MSIAATIKIPRFSYIQDAKAFFRVWYASLPTTDQNKALFETQLDYYSELAAAYKSHLKFDIHWPIVIAACVTHFIEHKCAATDFYMTRSHLAKVFDTTEERIAKHVSALEDLETVRLIKDFCPGHEQLVK